MARDVPPIFAPDPLLPPLSLAGRLTAAAVAGFAMWVLLTAATLTPSADGFGTHHALGLAPCSFLLNTGHPCASCGMTTSFALFADGSPLASFFAQPAGFVLVTLTAATVWAGGYAAITGVPLHRHLRRIPVVPLIWTGLSVVLAAWAWKAYSLGRSMTLTILLLTPLLAGGCNVIGAAAALAPPPTVPAQYVGLAGESVATMVWADRATLYDFPALRLDAAALLQEKLRQGADAGQSPLLGARFPVSPRDIVQYQLDYPEANILPAAEVAPAFGTTRLIYVEFEEFGTRADPAVELSRGTAVVTLRVVEIDADRRTRLAYEENGIPAVFPRTAPPEGIPRASDAGIYVGLIDAITSEIALRFMPHPDERRR